MVWRYLQAAIVLVLLSGCARAGGAVRLDEAPVSIYLVRFGWHADLVIPVDPCEPLPPGAPAHLEGASRVLVGWGDAGYYPRERPGIGATVRAALVPSASALLVFDVAGDVLRRYRRRDVLEFQISADACRRLGAFVRESLVVQDGRLVEVDSDRETAARFYLGTDRYHLLHNCNHWMARALRSADVDVRPWATPTVGLLWRSVRHQGRLVATSRDND